jgi:hypothetical protein
MKKLLLILFIFLNISARADYFISTKRYVSLNDLVLSFPATDYYIATAANGGSNSNSGLSGHPWLTLAYATAHATTSGDVIHVGVGTFTETAQMDLSVGVSIIGSGNTSIIDCRYSSEYNAQINLASGTEGTNGNQSISYVRFKGLADLSVWACIYIQARSNVVIHHCEFEDFENNAVTFNALAVQWPPAEASTYATGNSFYDNIVLDCSNYYVSNYNSGALQVGCQSGMTIYNNTMTSINRTDGSGYLIKYFLEHFGRNIKIYNNTLTKADPNTDGMDWNFCIEMWFPTGGIEIYDNTIHGSIDCLGTTKGSYDYAVSIHDNDIGYSSRRTHNYSGNNAAFFFDEGQEKTLIYKNNVTYTGTPIQSYPEPGQDVSDLYIYNNIFNGIGSTSHEWSELWAWAYSTDQGGGETSIDNINFVNNTCYNDDVNANNVGLKLPCSPDGSGADYHMTVTNVTIRNNFIQGFYYYPIAYNYSATGQTCDYLSIENNVFYGNSSNSVSQTGTTPTHYTKQNNSTSQPPFVSAGTDFHLTQSLDGIYISYVLTDYDGDTRANPPDIGAYEYVSAAPPEPLNGRIIVLSSSPTVKMVVLSSSPTVKIIK